MAVKGFLYGQTEYHLLHNAIHMKDYIEQAVRNQFTFLSITDPNLYGCYKFYQLCIKNNIKPIIGIECSFIDEDGYLSKILLYAKNNEGYRNLLKLNTSMASSSFSKEMLINHCDGLAVIIVYNESIFERLFISKAYLEVDNKFKEWQIFCDFYIGYSYTNRLDRLNSNQEFKKYAEERHIRCLPLHNCRYLKEEDQLIYEALIQIAGENTILHDYEDYSFDTEPQMTPELGSFIDSIELSLFTNKVSLPSYPLKKDVSALDYLNALCQKGLEKRLSYHVEKKYQNRLQYELSVIDKMGYADYFLIVWDFILWAKRNSILVGPGRGSAAGSLVAYCLGITDIDPLKYDLLFERFLNPERISMPDIDTDFPDDRRDEVIQYVKELYGSKHVCHISAFNTFLLRSSIRDLGRIKKMDQQRLDEMIKLVDSTSKYDDLLEQFKNRPEIYQFLYIIKGLEGLPRHISTHAAGIIISREELDDIIPLQQGVNGVYQSEWEAGDLAEIGLLKMDFLGIRNLSIIDSVLKEIPEFTMKDLRNIPLNDAKTFSLLENADTLGIFQLESSGIRRVLYKLRLKTFDDLVAVLALYRPGPMDNIDEFIERKHGKPFRYLHPALEPILNKTYGIIVYQEQIMLIAQSFAGFSLGQADLLRRAVSKKKESELKMLEDSFIHGAIQKGYDRATAVELYQYILKFANYGFNKSHSVAYGLLAYQMAYLKAHYFQIFIFKILNNVIGSTQTMIEYLHYAKAHGVKTYRPDINISSDVFVVHQGNLFMPLVAIHSIGEVAARQIISERKQHGLFLGFNDFKERCNLSSSLLEALIYAGAFDGFDMTKKQMIESKESYSEIFLKHLEDRIIDQSEFDVKYLRKKEAEYLGFNLTYDLFMDIDQLHHQYRVGYISQNNVTTIVSFLQVKEIKTKKNEQMLSGLLTDGRSTYPFVLFPQDYLSLHQKIETDILYRISYKMEVDSKTQQNKIILRNVMQV